RSATWPPMLFFFRPKSTKHSSRCTSYGRRLRKHVQCTIAWWWTSTSSGDASAASARRSVKRRRPTPSLFSSCTSSWISQSRSTRCSSPRTTASSLAKIWEKLRGRVNFIRQTRAPCSSSSATGWTRPGPSRTT
ncbi:unnamed protein product, partial [Prorocentrum cordatum]